MDKKIKIIVIDHDSSDPTWYRQDDTRIKFVEISEENFSRLMDGDISVLARKKNVLKIVIFQISRYGATYQVSGVFPELDSRVQVVDLTRGELTKLMSEGNVLEFDSPELESIYEKARPNSHSEMVAHGLRTFNKKSVSK